MPSRRAKPKSSFFTVDDFTTVQNQYFTSLREAGTVEADPSGWMAIEPPTGDIPIVRASRNSKLTGYYVDDGPGSIAKYKQRLAGLLSAWENRIVDKDEFTICPSGTGASLVVLATLKAVGVKIIRFETPTYYAAVEQTDLIGLTTDLVPTFRGTGYLLPTFATRPRGKQRMALWLTQPRFALGYDQSPDHLLNVLQEIAGNRGYLIIDEVMDQSFPAKLSILNGIPQSSSLIRIRSLVKPLGLNGIRLAVIMHPRSLRKAIVEGLEMTGGAVGVNSLETVSALAGDVNQFRMMLNAANRQVNSLRAKAQRMVAATPLSVNQLTNGYIGSMIANLDMFGKTQRQRRKRLLEWCRTMRTPIVPGASFYMALDPPYEAIRLNFFIRGDSLLKGIRNILTLWEC